MNTPWGKSDSIIKIARGVSWVGTPSHGGLAVTLRVASKMLSTAARNLAEFKPTKRTPEKFGWRVIDGVFFFEEDCAHAIAFYEHPEWKRDLERNEAALNNGVFTSFSDAEIRSQLLPILSSYYAEYLLSMNIIPTPKEYEIYLRNKEEGQLRQEKSPRLIVSAFGDWAEWVPKDKVGVITASDTKFLIDAADYPNKGYLMDAYPNAQTVNS